MKKLAGFQKKYLRGLAHALKPVIIVGQKGMSPALIKSVDEALLTHELIKVKFNEFKEKEQKKEISEFIEKQAGCEQVGMIGHIVTFYRTHPDSEQRKITVPERQNQE
ncbi:MAG: ribosome assembly RNA-binding protein YhbY [Desulfobacterales bacterium]|nr:ribosome assembly RNA-binding protein YhbY [Desulfobacterales bacterium]MDD4073200.1 ribosome assembly RNA-binding protein YhbY [Desulfobacterales bacterium]MDD4393979.1 ribosome assembly RNA-binding protein YhbY [Desulfobacterales bacterium]